VIDDNRSLKDIERHAYRSTFADGIYDILFGVIFLVFTVLAFLDSGGETPLPAYALLLIPLIIPWLGKRYITIPRLGAVEFGERRKTTRVIAWIAGAVILFLMLPLIIMMLAEQASGIAGLKLFAIVVAPLFVLAVYTTAFPRLYIYTGLLFAALVEAEFLLPYTGTPLNVLISFGMPGIVITGFGIALLIKFMQTHPHTEIDYGD
jgi:hypothetical protein